MRASPLARIDKSRRQNRFRFFADCRKDRAAGRFAMRDCAQ